MKKHNKFDKIVEESWAALGKSVAPILKDVAVSVASELAVDKIKNKLMDDEDQPVKISYTALVLDKESHKALVSAVEDLVPDNWELIAHHMTINMGPAVDRDIVGEMGEMVVKKLGVDHNLGVIAVGVDSDVFSMNKIKHITVAVNREVGAKPYLSNKIEDWITAPEGLNGLTLTGTVEEVPFKK